MLKQQIQHKLYAYYGVDIWTVVTNRSVTHPVLGKRKFDLQNTTQRTD